MKILYVFPRVVDDALQNTTENEIARALVRHGCNVDTVQSYRRERLSLDGFSTVRYLKIDHYGVVAKLRLHGASLWAALTGDYDVVMFSYSAAHLIPIVALRQKLKGRPKLVLDIRSVPVDVDKGFRGRMLEFRYRMALRLADWLCDGVTAITPMLSETLKPFLRRLGDHVGIWASGVDLDHFQRSEVSTKEVLGLAGSRVIMYHGVLSPNRGIQNIIRAVELLSDEMNDLRFLVVGDGPGRGELESLAAACHIADRVIFTGHKPYSEIPRYIAAADVGILSFPNIQWWAVSSPIKLMEYLAMGLPMVATDIPAVRIVTDETGGVLLVPSDQPEHLADGIRRFFKEGCKPASRDVLENVISWNAQGRRLLDYFETL